MRGRHVTFGEILEHLRGEADEEIEVHLRECPECAALRDKAERFLHAGARAIAAPQPSRRALQRAVRIFREAQAPGRSAVLRLVLDSLLRPAPALRTQAATPTRFLRYEGRVTVEIQIAPGARGVELRGQITPADHTPEVVLLAGKTRRKSRVEADGTFVLSGVPKRTVELRIGDARIPDLEL